MDEMKTIKEYVNTGDGTAGTLLIPRVILPTLIDEAEKALIPRELAAMVLGPAQIAGPTAVFNLLNANTMDIRVVGEGAEIPMDEATFTSTTVTPLKYGVAIRITREMMEDSQFPMLEWNLKVAGRRFAENENSLILTCLDGVTSTVTGGASLTVANIAEAVMDVEEYDYAATDIVIGNEALNDLRNIDVFIEAQKRGNADFLSRNIVGSIFGMNVVRFSTNAAPSSTYSKYAYVFDRSATYCIAIKRDMSVENFILPTYDMQGSCLTQRIGVVLLRANAGTQIITS